MGQVLKGLVERRKQVKGWLKRTSDILKYQQLDIQQQALKLTANRFFLIKSGNTSFCVLVSSTSQYTRGEVMPL
jgi:DNA polymerase elongation subunit (family B)